MSISRCRFDNTRSTSWTAVAVCGCIATLLAAFMAGFIPVSGEASSCDVVDTKTGHPMWYTGLGDTFQCPNDPNGECTSYSVFEADCDRVICTYDGDGTCYSCRDTTSNCGMCNVTVTHYVCTATGCTYQTDALPQMNFCDEERYDDTPNCCPS